MPLNVINIAKAYVVFSFQLHHKTAFNRSLKAFNVSSLFRSWCGRQFQKVRPEIWKPLTPIVFFLDFGTANCPSDADLKWERLLMSDNLVNRVGRYARAKPNWPNNDMNII